VHRGGREQLRTVFSGGVSGPLCVLVCMLFVIYRCSCIWVCVTAWFVSILISHQSVTVPVLSLSADIYQFLPQNNHRDPWDRCRHQGWAHPLLTPLLLNLLRANSAPLLRPSYHKQRAQVRHIEPNMPPATINLNNGKKMPSIAFGTGMCTNPYHIVVSLVQQRGFTRSPVPSIYWQRSSMVLDISIRQRCMIMRNRLVKL
jgi:hypothetical protein